MKTNKEIKPFKMRCNLSESKIVMSILRKRGHDTKWTPRQDSENLCIVLYNSGNFSCLYDFSYLDYLGDDDCKELTYSEFMKLYGEEEEMFTREDMIMFAYGTLCSLSHSSTEEDVEHLLTAYLSTRTND